MYILRTFRNSAILPVALAAFFVGTAAAEYPDKPIKLIVGFPAGQSSDANARRIAYGMSTLLKQSVIVDNKPGAAGAIAHAALKNSPADGYTLAIGSTGTLAINPHLYRSLPYTPLKDFEPVILISASPLAVFVPANSPLNNFKDLVAYGKAKPGKVTYGSGGSGSTGHISMEMIKRQAGIDLLHVPYKGGPPMITDLIGGQVDVAIEPLGSILPFMKSGKVKFLGISTLKRYAPVPETPTLAEQGLEGFEAVPWTVMLAPKGTPAEIVQKLNKIIAQVLKEPVVAEDFVRTGSLLLGGSSAVASKYLQDESARWGPAVRASGAQVD